MRSAARSKKTTMIKAVLLDLDNTLLLNPDRRFAVAYLQSIDTHFESLWGQPHLSQVVMQGLATMLGSRDMQQTNTTVALEAIREAVGRSVDEVQAAFDQFYSQRYPQLADCIEPVAAAPGLIQYLRQQDIAVVIATNPIYPEKAVQQRMAWANLPDDKDIYALITHGDNMHFAKPNAAYYGEILARVGIEPDEAIMIGDSQENDIQPAAQIGIHTYHITNRGNHATEGRGQGTLDYFHQIVREGWLESLVRHPLVHTMIEPQYQGNVAALFGMLADVKPHHWQQHPDPNEWSILEILCHLWESEANIYRHRLERIRREDNPFIVSPKAAVGPPEKPCHTDGKVVAQRFLQEREKTMAFLKTIQPDEWQRPARHSIFGLTTLLEMAHFTAQHDRLHLNQLCQTLGRCED